jgi:spore coat polysaccharide biosynthesis predicted glycosyltransferase SpsG
VKICFIADGGRQMGMGHVLQATTFAKEFRTAAAATFVTKSDDTVLSAIRESGFQATGLQTDADILRHLRALNPDIIVFDKIDVDEELARNIKKTIRAGLVIFTNLTAANRHADIAVTADIGSCFKNVSYTDSETNTRYYYGPRYWILRPEFHGYDKKASRRRPERVLLIFGGSDPSNLTSVALEELLGMKEMPAIDVILGAHFAHHESVDRILARSAGKAGRITVHKNVRNVAALMYRADLAIASPGLSVFEALRVGTPVIVMPHDDLQRDTYMGFMRMLEKKEISELAPMIETADFTYPDEHHIATMEIGEGVGELRDAILNSVKR